MLQFTFEVVDGIARHILEMQVSRPGEEVGGMLFGTGVAGALNGHVTRAQQLVNRATDPFREWSANPDEMSVAITSEERSGRQLVGTFHTHPFGDTTLSRADVQLMQAVPPVLLLVAAPLDNDRGRWEWKVHHADHSGGGLPAAILPPRALRL